MNYRRAKTRGGTYFFTIVTFNRMNILCTPKHIVQMREAFNYVKKRHPLILDAIAILPDHLHFILTLPLGDANFPTRLMLLKSHFTRNCVTRDHEISASRIRKKEKAIWQRRYWEHLIRDEEDFTRHVDYIHYNPVKHGLAEAPKDWDFSSFQSYVKKEIYDRDWAMNQELIFEDEVGYE